MPGLSAATSHRSPLRRELHDPILDVMDFLNEVSFRYPDAISFAAGRPPEDLFDVAPVAHALDEFVAHAAGTGDLDEAWNELGRYNRTNGIVNAAVARHLLLDEEIHVEPDAIMVTVGAQEAMAVTLMGLFDPATDVLLVSDPAYVGITGLARMIGIRVVPVPAGASGLEPDVVEASIAAASRHGRARALYDVPDFNNPLGTQMPLEHRRALLDICRRHDLLFIEDNAYGMFRYEGEKLPTVKALDTSSTVLYIGSFAKTIFPSLRLGYLVADQLVAESGRTLASELSRVKGYLTVNTSTLLQGMCAGTLARAGGSLEPLVRPKRERLRHNRDVLLDALGDAFAPLRSRVTWNRPAGGFFLTLTVPFEFGAAELGHCAADYGVIACPMRFFSLCGDRRQQIRLAFAHLGDEAIREGVARLSRYIHERARTTNTSAEGSC